MAARRKKKAAPKSDASNDNLPSRRRGGRPAWQGHLRLSLVSCPVALINATTRSNDISFHLINPDTNNRIRMIPTDPDSGPVERSVEPAFAGSATNLSTFAAKASATTSL